MGQVADRTGARFGVFEVDFASGELRKRGIRIPIQAQPLEILRILIERPGEVVTRGELRDRLWPADTFVDFEHSLNSSVKKLRQAIGDSSDNPRFVETLSRRGYRFIAPVQELAIAEAGDIEASLDGRERVQALPEAPGRVSSEERRHGFRFFAIAGLCLLLLPALYWLFPASAPKAARLLQLTHSVAVDEWGGLVTDGARLFFLERERDHWNVVQTSTSGGPVEKFPAPFRNTKILDVAPDLSELLVASFVERGSEMPLWIMPAQGGAPRRVGDVTCTLARWMPGGRQILFGKGKDLFVVSSDGSGSRTFLRTAGNPWSPSWSPDGRRLRFTVLDPGPGKATSALWEVSADGQMAHPILADHGDPRGDCCGSFSTDGRFFLFSSYRGGHAGIWAVREGTGFPRRIRRAPVLLTEGPGAFWNAVPGRDGKRFFLFGSRPGLDELSRYEIKTKRLARYMPEIPLAGASYSRDGKWIAYTVGPDPESTIWRSRADGSERRQLTFPALHAHRPTWSADGSRIAFQGELAGGAPRVYVVPSEGGASRPIAGEGTQAFPDWSPDGKSLALTVYSDLAEFSPTAIVLVDPATGRIAKLQGSGNLISPKWSPDQSAMAALSADQKKLRIFDLRAATWTEMASGVLLTGLNWSADGAFLYFQDLLEKDQPVYRLHIADGGRERVADFRGDDLGGVSRIGFAGLTPSGDLLVLLRRGHADVYALDLE